MKKAGKILLTIIGSFILVSLGLLVWLTLTDFRPTEVEKLSVDNNSELKIPLEFIIFNWNIGYGALGEDADFFFDGGETIITPKSDYTRYREGILDIVNNTDADIFNFQEVDIKSKRSYNDNQYELLSGPLSDYSRSYAINYKVAYIPPPAFFKTSYGRVTAGLATFSKYGIDESTRLSLPGSYSWPKRVLFLDRCMIVSKINTVNDTKVVIINTHNSAYDQGGFIKQDQLQYIKNYAKKEYYAGNYVIIGGDWNSYMPGTNGESFKSTEKASVFNQGLPDNWNIDGWNWGVDPKTPTSRSLKTKYTKGENFECVIDGFIVSPNIKIKNVKTYDLGFKFSDHNPIELKVELN